MKNNYEKNKEKKKNDDEMMNKENMHSDWTIKNGELLGLMPNLSTEIFFYNRLISLLFTSVYIKNTNYLKNKMFMIVTY